MILDVSLPRQRRRIVGLDKRRRWRGYTRHSTSGRGVLTMRQERETMIESFASWQRMRGFSEATICRRRRTLTAFAKALAPRTYSEASLEDLERFLGSQASARTRHAYRSDLRVFYRWAFQRGLMAENPAALVEPVKVPRGLPRPLRAPDVAEAISVAPYPVRARLALGFYAGLRAGEIAKLRGEDIDYTMETVTVRAGKGGKDRVVDMHRALRDILEGWAPRSGYLFPGHHGRDYVRPATISYSVSSYLASCGIDAVCHQLRHTFGSELTRVTAGDLVTVGKQMGHISPATTANYAGWAGQGRTAVQSMYGGDAA